jgi:hypothetical protein
MKTGRKSKFEELQMAQRYSDLSGKAFEFLTECLEGKNKELKMWAVEQLGKGLVKMIPQVQQLSGNPNDSTPIPIYNAKSLKQ